MFCLRGFLLDWLLLHPTLLLLPGAQLCRMFQEKAFLIFPREKRFYNISLKPPHQGAVNHFQDMQLDFCLKTRKINIFFSPSNILSRSPVIYFVTIVTSREEMKTVLIIFKPSGRLLYTVTSRKTPFQTGCFFRQKYWQFCISHSSR